MKCAEFDPMVARAARREFVWVSPAEGFPYMARLLFWSNRPKVQLPCGKVVKVLPEDVLVRRPS